MRKTTQYEAVRTFENQSVRPFFSIIIPAYNAEKYIGECLEAIFAQSFADYEIIVVNDGSTDGTWRVLESFAHSHIELRILSSQHNQGAAAARNWGIAESGGKYILFVDADDIIAKGLLDTIYQKIYAFKGRELKLLVFGVTEEYYDRKERCIKRKSIIPRSVETCDSSQIHNTIAELECQTLYGYLWNKAYNADYLKALGIKIPQMRILEDIYFNIQYCQDINSILVLNTAAYIYKKRYGTATGGQIPDYYDIHRERMRRLIKQYESWGILEDNRKKLAITYTRYVYSALQRIKRREVSIGERNVGEWLKNLFEYDEVYKELIEKTVVSDYTFKGIMYTALKKKNIFIVLMIARVIAVVQWKMRRIYLRLN